MKRLFFSLLLTLIALCPLTACGQKAAPATTWQEQYDLGIRYLSEGNYEEAIIAFTAAIEIDPKRPEAYLSLADAYIATGDPEAAWKALEEGLAATEDPNIQTRLVNWASGGTDSRSQQLQPGYPRTEEGDYGDGRRYVAEYDAYGNIVKNTQYDAGGALLYWSEYSYDAAGRQTDVPLPGGARCRHRGPPVRRRPAIPGHGDGFPRLGRRTGRSADRTGHMARLRRGVVPV